MLINLTPHALKIYGSADDDAPVVVLAPSGQVARCSTTRTPDGFADGVPLFKSVTGDVIGLPAPVRGTIFIASGFVQSAVKDARSDVRRPGDLIRDATGQVVGCIGLDG